MGEGAENAAAGGCRLSVVVLDYGSGNVRSVVRALERAGSDLTGAVAGETAGATAGTTAGATAGETAGAAARVTAGEPAIGGSGQPTTITVTLTADPEAVLAADGLVVPGVGAYAACMAGLRSVGADALIAQRINAGRPVLGICVGMQVLYQAGNEHGIDTPGLGILAGRVEPLRAPIIPHLGWNTVTPPAGSEMFLGCADDRFYFVHSYAAHPGAHGVAGVDEVETITVHGEPFVAAVEAGAVWASQFHPEKSGDAGRRLLANWLATVGRAAPPAPPFQQDIRPASATADAG